MRLLLVLLLVVATHAWADQRAGEKKAQLCLLCHKRSNVMASAPLLEAQPANYLIAQINAYKTGKRPDPAMRSNVANLTTRDIADIALYFSKQPAPAGVRPVDPSKAGLGEKRLAELKCAGCHQKTFHGEDATPRLAGQTSAYLVQQLEGFIAGRRAHPTSEMSSAKADELEHIAAYLASLD
jgi:cytochrome c553